MAIRKQEPRSRGQIIPRGDGRWLIRMYLGRDSEGVRKYHNETFYGTFKEAEKHLTKKLSESDAQTFVGPTKLTVKQWGEQWLKGRVNLSEKSRREYTHRLEKDVFTALGAVRLDKLTPFQVQQFVNSLSERGLAPRTVEYTFTVLKSSLGDAVEQSIIAKNPCRGVNTPKKVKVPPAVWTSAEVQRFLSVPSPDHCMWLLALTAGLRPEEYLALQWSEVDLDAGLVRIVRALNEDSKGRYVVGTPKTKASWRSITLPKETVEALKEHRKKLAAIAGFVFPGDCKGGFMDISAVRRRFKKTIAAAEVPEIPLYNMRHTHATLLLTAGVHPKVVQERLGHSTITVTMDTYSHVLMSLQTQTADTLSGILFRSTDSSEAVSRVGT